jgi:hypothetical protein
LVLVHSNKASRLITYEFTQRLSLATAGLSLLKSRNRKSS